MKAVILAAGSGARLHAVTGGLPKCLAQVGTMTLLDRQIAALRAHGITDITVVAGHGLLQVSRACGAGVRIVNNPQYASTNSLYSLWLVRDQLAEGFVVMNCDVLFHRQLLTDLLTAQYPDALLMSAAGSAVYSAEEMKIRLRRGCVTAIAKTLAPEEADGENVGIVKFGAAGAQVLCEEMDRLIAAGDRRSWFPAALAEFARRRPLYAVETRGYPWIEIDFPEDYRRACLHVLPALEPTGSVRDAALPQPIGARRVLHHV